MPAASAVLIVTVPEVVPFMRSEPVAVPAAPIVAEVVRTTEVPVAAPSAGVVKEGDTKGA